MNKKINDIKIMFKVKLLNFILKMVMKYKHNDLMQIFLFIALVCVTNIFGDDDK